MRHLIRLRSLFTLAISFMLVTPMHADDGFRVSTSDTWANWNNRWEMAFANVQAHKLPGRAMGIIVPADSRDDILPMSAFGYETIARSPFRTVIILLQAPADYNLEGLAMPTVDTLETSFGRFPVDTLLRNQIVGDSQAAVLDPNLFVLGVPKILQRQLSGLKYVLRKDMAALKVLPIYVKFSDINSQAKDYAPYLVGRLRDVGVELDVAFLIVANLTRAPSEEKLVETDTPLLKNIRELNIDAMLATKTAAAAGGVTNDDFSALILGILTLRTLGADHADILAYAHSGQLVLTKDRSSPLSYVTAGFASRPPYSDKIPHVKQEKLAEIFGELLRADMLALARQTFLSTIDTTAAKPPAINNPQAGKKWPVYISVFEPQGKLAGQAGSHVATGPLEESIRKYTFEATQQAQPTLTKANAASYVIDISVPYGFSTMEGPNSYVPLLHGLIVTGKLKTKALHPEAWRIYPDPHQLLSSVCTKLGAEPWAYATSAITLESFRIFSFNEKEPFQDLGSSKKKKKKKEGDEFDDTGGGTGGGGFSF